jgi:hypothetical protein
MKTKMKETAASPAWSTSARMHQADAASCTDIVQYTQRCLGLARPRVYYSAILDDQGRCIYMRKVVINPYTSEVIYLGPVMSFVY